MSKWTSPYYPPRAGWHSRFLSAGSDLRRRLVWRPPALPVEMTVGGILATLLVPGLGIYLRGPRFWGKVALAVVAVLLFVFVGWLGYPVANFAFALLLSLHASGISYYSSPLFPGEDFMPRLAVTGATLMALSLLLYGPVRDLVEHHLLIPLSVNGQVVIVRNFGLRPIHRGDWVAYESEKEFDGDPHNGGAVLVRQGLWLGPVLAEAGDIVTFQTNTYSVNGVSRPSLPHMPSSGEWAVPVKQWLIWPQLGMAGGGVVTENHLSGVLMKIAIVSQTQYVGQPFGHWLWRKQVLP